MTLEILHNCPIPPKATGSKAGEITTALKAMQSSDSFIVATESDRKNVSTTAQRIGIKVTTRKVNGKGYQVWKL